MFNQNFDRNIIKDVVDFPHVFRDIDTCLVTAIMSFRYFLEIYNLNHRDEPEY